jgi:hypothetical protein
MAVFPFFRNRAHTPARDRKGRQIEHDYKPLPVRRGLAMNFRFRLQRSDWVSVTIKLGHKAEEERGKHEADSSFLFSCKDENLAADSL